MSRMEFRVEWLPEPGPDEAFGPERATWGRVEIRLDGENITSNHPADWRGDERAAVVGGMSGLADWIVDSLLPVRFEAHTPFPKMPSFSARRGGRFPSLRDAGGGWPEFAAEHERQPGGELGEWQQRHTLGTARSDLALPSITFVPEGTWMGIGLDHLPASLAPTVRFTPPVAPDSWPAAPVWIPTTDVSAAFAGFITDVVARAERFPDSARWAEWLSARWCDNLRAATDEATVLRWSLGEVVATAWAETAARLGESTVALSGVLADARLVKERRTLHRLVELLAADVGFRRRPGVDLGAVDWALPPYREGYRLAQEVRSRLKLGEAPLDARKLSSMMRELHVEPRPAQAMGLFRSACWTTREGAVLMWADDDAALATPPPRRFAIAAALGRLLSAPAEERMIGVAHGAQARYRPTQLANAFAAELLLPVQAIQRSRGSTDALAKRYGISRSAAEWHVHNRYPLAEA
jgi:hypothetical protein